MRATPAATFLAATLGLAGCGDDLQAPLTGPIDQRLAALPDVHVTEWIPPGGGPVSGDRYFDLEFTQPLDHDHPENGTYQQYAALIHHADDAPLVVYAGGYNAGWLRQAYEPTSLVEGNQISLEYRFYGNSRNPDTNWGQLDVAQAQEDQHAIVAALARVYPSSARIATGASKGGENALEAIRRHPEDYDGAVAYVAPVITDLPDTRYASVIERIGLPDCTAKLRALQRAMLQHRSAMESNAAVGGTYDLVGVGKATETAIVELVFSYWMTLQVPANCNQIPADTVNDTQLYAFLQAHSAPTGYDDETQRASGMQYTWQFARELGYPVWEHDNIDDVMMYSYEDWTAFLPPGTTTPAYDPSQPRALADWVTHDARHVLLLDGEWDPWSAGYPASVPSDHDAFRLVVPHGSHWSTGIYSLTVADQAVALDALSRWTGKTIAPGAAAVRRGRAMPELGPRLVPGSTDVVVGVRVSR